MGWLRAAVGGFVSYRLVVATSGGAWRLLKSKDKQSKKRAHRQFGAKLGELGAKLSFFRLALFLNQLALREFAPNMMQIRLTKPV